MARADKVVADDIEEPEIAETTVREDIEAAREEINARTDPAGEPATGARDDGRDDSGRFRARAEPADASLRPGAQGDPERAPVQAPAAGAPENGLEAPPSTQLAPQGWTPAGKAIWQTLPEAARVEIMKREQDAHRAITKQDEERQVARQFNDITQAHAEIVQRTGQHPLKLYQDFLGYASTLTTGNVQQKAALLRDIAMRNGIDPRALAGMMPPPGTPNSQGQPNPAASPPITSLPPEVAETVKWAKEYQARQQQEAREADEKAQQKTLEEIVAFRSKPEARFFDAVKDQMVALLQSGAVANLEEAYNQAIWTRPDIRQILQAEEANKANAARLKQQKSAQARVRGGSVRGIGGAVPDSVPGNRSLREELQANFAEARSRI